ncbi:MAG: FAD:protein FMN transferase [Chitinophagales bacterium]
MQHKIRLKLMGSAFEIIVIEDNHILAEKLLKEAVEEIKRIENELTEFDENSFTSLININAGIQPVKVTEEVYQLLKRCKNISHITQGAFDITVSPLKKLYNFKNGDFTFPEKNKIQNVLKLTGFEHLKLLPENTVYLTKKGMRISFAAIGKGYAADCVKKKWKQQLIKGGAVNASGDLCVFGNEEDGNPWKIGIQHPDDKNKMLFSIPLREGAIATSGDYEQYFIKDGIRFSHTIHPKTGLPIKGIKSVSVLHSSAELCDALATAVYVMGAEVGLHFINQLPNTHAVIINSENKVFLSDNIEVENEIS